MTQPTTRGEAISQLKTLSQMMSLISTMAEAAHRMAADSSVPPVDMDLKALMIFLSDQEVGKLVRAVAALPDKFPEFPEFFRMAPAERVELIHKYKQVAEALGKLCQEIEGTP